MRKLLMAAAAALCSFVVTAPEKASAQEFWLGQIVLGGWNFCPRTTLAAAGQLLAINSNTALFSLYGTTFGGDGRTTFGLPDLRGRAAISEGRGPGLSTYVWGQRGGAERHTMNILEMPSHNHVATNNVTSQMALSQAPVNATTGQDNSLSNQAASIYTSAGAPSVTLDDGTITTTVQTTVLNNGGSQPFNIRGPYLTLQYCVVQFGIFPSRS